MEVIKHGNTHNEVKCPHCGALLDYSANDILTHSATDDYFGYYYEWDLIKCLDCGGNIILKERTIEI